MDERANAMHRLLTSNQSDTLRISLIWGVGWVLGISVLFISLSNPDVILGERMRSLYLAVAFYACAFVPWLVDEQQPILSRWLLPLILIVLVVVGITWVNEPGFFALLSVPVMLAQAFAGMPTAVATAGMGTLALLVLPPALAVHLPERTLLLGIAVQWTTVGLMMAVYRPMVEITTWALEHFEQAQALLEESRDRKAELQEARDNLIHANRELLLLNERLHILRQEADAARNAKALFVSKVSHEFRTPLNMIIGLADLLIETPEVYGEKLPESLLDDLKIVQRNCQHLANLVDDVLNLGQIEAGQLALNREWVDLNEDLDTTVMVVQPLIEKKKLSIHINRDLALPLVNCDRMRLRQVLLNLVSNAARFTETGGITLSVGCDHDDVVLSVADTGPGIAPEDSERIFEPFFQGNVTGPLQRGGSGLGLSISRQFVELHKGRIWLESQPGTGTTFFIRLPIAPPDAGGFVPQRWLNEDWVWQQHTSAAPLPRSPYKERVMLVDATGTLTGMMMPLRDDVEFVAVQHLEAARQALEQVPAHVLLANAQNPEQMLTLARIAQTSISDTPVIICSYQAPIKRAQEAGALDYLTKPVKAERLLQSLRGLPEPMRRVMIVDDNHDLQQLLTRILTGYDPDLSIISVTDGREALPEMRRVQPDVVLLDLALPHLDGWQILALKADDPLVRDIPTLIVSAQDVSDQPTRTAQFTVMMQPGVSPSKLLDCALELSRRLLSPS